MGVYDTWFSVYPKAIMSLRHAILTALLERPSSGLDLTRRFDRSIRFFWSATHQQVYRELAKLEAEGLVRAVPQPPSRGSRKEYEVLGNGRDDLLAWVGRSEGPKPIRDPLLVRLRAAAALAQGRESILAQMRLHRAEHQRQLDEYLEIAERDFKKDDLDEAGQLRGLILKAGIGLEEFWISWLEDSIADISVMCDVPAERS